MSVKVPSTAWTPGSDSMTVNLSPRLKWKKWSISKSIFFSFFHFSYLVLVKIGALVAPWTAQSTSECLLTKFKFASDKDKLSFEHIPGLGSGICDLDIGNQFELLVSWFLNDPTSKALVMSLNLNAQIALPAIELSGVLKTP
jgi:hypothetical protein